MSIYHYAGDRLREAFAMESPLQMVGVSNAFCALLAERVGIQALYLSGAGVANGAFGLPDLAMITQTEVAEEARRITNACSLPMLVDVDVGYGHGLMIERTVLEMERARVAGIQIEDQQAAKRCGHRSGKQLVSAESMVSRLEHACAAKTDQGFVIAARTDAYESEGIAGVIKRGKAYRDAGADLLFPEALASLEEFKLVAEEVGLPVIANMTEFGKTPLFTLSELRDANVAVALYPLSAFRAMAKAAEEVYEHIHHEGSQLGVIDKMQTRQALYDVLGYERFEQQLDKEDGDG